MKGTHLIIKGVHYDLKYERKMSRGEVERMKSFMTKGGVKLTKSPKFRISKVEDFGDIRMFSVVL